MGVWNGVLGVQVKSCLLWGSSALSLVARLLTRSASAPFSSHAARVFRRRARFRIKVAALLMILFVTMGLAIRAGAYARQLHPAESDSRQERGPHETGFLDACARTFVLVLLALLGLLALGMMYGNVLGSANS